MSVYKSANSAITPEINKMTKVRIPNPKEMKQNVFAFFAASKAPALSPLSHSLSTLVELIIAGMPNGQQQSTVTSIDHTKRLSGFVSVVF